MTNGATYTGENIPVGIGLSGPLHIPVGPVISHLVSSAQITNPHVQSMPALQISSSLRGSAKTSVDNTKIKVLIKNSQKKKVEYENLFSL